jgi:hypothetical protein
MFGSTENVWDVEALIPTEQEREHLLSTTVSQSILYTEWRLKEYEEDFIWRNLR